MAYLTLVNQALEGDAFTSYINYITAQTNAGTTDGIRVTVFRSGVYDTDNVALPLVQRSWSTSDAANAYIAFSNTLSPAPVYAQVVAPL